MNPEAMLSLFRQVVTLVSGYFVGKGMISGADSTTLVSALVSLASVGWSIYSHFGMKKVPEAAKVVVAPGALGIAIVFALLCLEGDGGAAQAANLSPPALTKANPFAGYAAGRCGAYAGLNTMGVAGAVNGGPPGASIIQGDIGVTLGYGCPIGNNPGSFWFVEGNFDFANINGNATGLGLTGPAHFEQRAALGSPISTLLGTFPGNPFGGVAVPSLPVLPAGVTAGTSYPFFFVSLHEQDVSAQFGIAQNREWLFSPGVGIGLETRLSNGVVVDTTAQWKLDSNGVVVGPQKVTLGNAAIVGLTLKY